jgi:uncharacterized protein
MRTVSDTSVICNLAMIGRLRLLQRKYAEILITPEVASELAQLKHLQARRAIEDAEHEGWLKMVVPVRSLEHQPGLHAGELASMALALEEPDALLLIDERNGRAAARLLGITLTGVIGVLIGAKKADWIPSLKPELLALREDARFYISPGLFDEALRLVGEA